MKKKNAISIFLALLMIVSAFAASTANASGCEGEVDFSKKVWDSGDEQWVEEIDAELGETVRFNITMTYHRHPENQQALKVYNIKVWDVLPDCLEFDNNVVIESPGNTFDYTQEEVGNTVYWNFTEETKLYLDDGESLYIEFDATVVESEELDNQNWAYFTATECGQYTHEDEDDAWVYVQLDPEPSISVEKTVKEYESEGSYVDELILHKKLVEIPEMEFTFNPEITVAFKIVVENDGTEDLVNVTVMDVLPEGLTYEDNANIEPDYIDENNYFWNFSSLDSGESVTIKFLAKTSTCGEYLNEVFAEGEHEEGIVEDSDNASLIYSGINLVKEVYYDGEWVKEVPEVIKGQDIRFRISIDFIGDGNIRHFIDCGYVVDFLPEGCLEYLETASIKMNGDVIDPESNEYPYVIPDHGDILEICGDTINITDLMENSEACIPDGDLIIWEFSSAHHWEMHDGDTLEIEFLTNVTNYCEECDVTNYAAGLMWNCDICYNWFDWDSAIVNCDQPDNKFEKKISLDGETWEDEIETFQGDTVEFKIEFEYYGNEMINDTRIKDELPCVLEYVEGSANVEPTSVSDDKKTIWWNLTEEIEDGETLVITFDAYVEGYTGTCPECSIVYNHAWIYAYYNPGGCAEPVLVFEDHDTAGLGASVNNKPCITLIGEDGQEGDEDKELTYQVVAEDPEEDDVYYQINWGDETSGWLGPYTSGVETDITHSWDEEGEYTIKARAKDVYGKVGSWGPEINVTINPGEEPEPDLSAKIDSGLLSGGIKWNAIGVTVTNNMEGNLTNVTFNGTINYGILLKKTVDVYSDNNTAEEGANGFNFPVVQGILKGRLFSTINVNLTMTCDEGYELPNITGSGFMLLGRLVFINNATPVELE